MADETTVSENNSESLLMDEVYKLADAGGSLIQIRTREASRAALVLRRSILSNTSYQYKEWDLVNGTRAFTTENLTDSRNVRGDGKDFVDALQRPLEELRTPGSNVNANPSTIHYFVYMNGHPFIKDNPYVTELLQQYMSILPTSNVCILLVTDDAPLPLPTGTVLTTELRTPTAPELRQVLDRLIENSTKTGFDRPTELSEEERDQICALGQGMTRYEFETHAAISVVQASLDEQPCVTPENFMEGIAKGKTEVVKQSDILELFHPEDIENVGGMHRLKDWIAARRDAFSEDAKEFGIEAPKGIFIAGVPGSGKSLIAKAIAGTLGIPLLRLDFGRVFSKFIGDSESRMRQSLKMIEDMGRLVLFADEIDKGLGGIGSGGGDSGTSSRVLGAFLTWMQETKSQVFVVMTANRVEGLPPELTRKGRMDQIFATGLPNDEERREVLEVHLRKRKRAIDDFAPRDIKRFLENSDGYVPAEIEQAVKDALILAYNDKKAKDLEMPHLIAALKGIVPMSKSHKVQIDRILEWAAKNAISVSYSGLEDRSAWTATADEAQPAAGRAIRTARRTSVH